MPIVASPNELHVHAAVLTRSDDAPFDEVVRLEQVSDLTELQVSALDLRHRGAGCDVQAFNLREPCDERFGDGISERGVGRSRTEVVERKDRDAPGLVRCRLLRRSLRRDATSLHTISPTRTTKSPATKATMVRQREPAGSGRRVLNAAGTWERSFPWGSRFEWARSLPRKGNTLRAFGEDAAPRSERSGSIFESWEAGRAEHLHGDGVFLDLVGTSRERSGYRELEQTLELMGVGKQRACEQPLESGVNRVHAVASRGRRFPSTPAPGLPIRFPARIPL